MIKNRTPFTIKTTLFPGEEKCTFTLKLPFVPEDKETDIIIKLFSDFCRNIDDRFYRNIKDD